MSMEKRLAVNIGDVLICIDEVNSTIIEGEICTVVGRFGEDRWSIQTPREISHNWSIYEQHFKHYMPEPPLTPEEIQSARSLPSGNDLERFMDLT